jgi:adenylate cyclase
MLCPDCGRPTALAAVFCHHCGRRLNAPGDGLQVGDRRVITALFADLVGYTRLVDELDPEEVRARVDGALAVLAEAVVHFGGSLEKFVGDALLAVFGVPVAHDDDGLRACLCALEMQAVLARRASGVAQPMEIRVGIATGEVVAALREVAGTRSVALTGDPMTTAARLQQMAEPNEILVDDATFWAAEPRISVEAAGEKLLRGQRRPVQVHRLRGEKIRLGYPCREAAPLIGRDAEKARIVELLRKAAETGKGGTVLLRGEPGIGKSRLLCEMEEDVRAAGLAWMWLDNPPHGMDSPYRAVRHMVDWLADEQGVAGGVVARQLLFGDDVAPDLSPEAARLMAGAVAVLAHESDMNLVPEEGWEPGPLEAIDPADLQVGLQLATHMWVTRMSGWKPRCIVIDDFHWIDPSSRHLMDMMIRMSGELPMVVLTGSRPPVMPDWAGLPFVEVIELGGLDQVATEELSTAVAGSALDPESARWLYERTAGNALFVGEIMRTLRETGRLERVGEHLRIDRGTARQSVPLSLRALLGARIDSLPPAQRSALEVASVFGMTFSESALLALCGEGVGDVDLRGLAEAGIVAGAEEPGLPSGQWRFKHQLFLDAAYGRLLADRRHMLHGALADLLETSGPRPDIAELARHRVASGDGARALPLLEQAAREAAALGAVSEAEAFSRTAAEISGRGDPISAANAD